MSDFVLGVRFSVVDFFAGQHKLQAQLDAHSETQEQLSRLFDTSQCLFNARLSTVNRLRASRPRWGGTLHCMNNKSRTIAGFANVEVLM